MFLQFLQKRALRKARAGLSTFLTSDERNAAVAKYSLLADKPQLFASKYQRLIPTEDELRAELERDRALLENARTDTDD